MQKLKNKIAAITIAIFFMLSMSASMMLIPTASAQTPALSIPTYAYITAAPNLIGVGQTSHVIMWLDKLWDNAALTNDYRFHNYELVITAPDGANTTETFPVVSDPTSAQDYSFTPSAVGQYTLTFIFPGQTITATNDIPTSPYIGDYYEPNTASTNVTVQSALIAAAITGEPLPTNYWTRPIYGENTNWYTISSNWLGFGVAPAPSFATSGDPGYEGWGATANQLSFPVGAGVNDDTGDAVGSLTNHIMWTMPIQSGGVVGGNTVAIPGDTYFEGSAYSQRYTNPIIVNGMLIYNPPIAWDGVASSQNTGEIYGPTTCVNLQTGKVIWTNPNMPAPSFAYIYDAQDPNQHGVWPPVLICSTASNNFIGPNDYGIPSTPGNWEAFDAGTGTWIFNVTNVPGGYQMLGPSGEVLILDFVNYGPTTTVITPLGPETVPTGPEEVYLQEWNSSRLWVPNYSGPSTVPSLTPQVTNGSWTGGYMYVPYIGETYVPSLLDFNISMPTLQTTPTILDAFYNREMICENGTFPGGPEETFSSDSWSPYTYIGISLSGQNNDDYTGIPNIMWTNTVTPPAGNITVEPGGADITADNGHGVFVEAYKETRQWVGYSMATGQKLWGPTASEAPLDYYGNPYIPIMGGCCAYGTIYSTGYAGILYAWNMTTGDLEWTWGNGPAGSSNSSYAGFNTPFGVYPMQINAIGNGVVYMVTTEHTIETPLFKGAFESAINATTGREIWEISGYTGEFEQASYAMADGYNTWFNGYDNSIYVVGRGPSATTVKAPQTAVTAGTQVAIQGTVLDISAGTTQTEQAADFPHGVPCASDASMSQWMSYVYQQQPEPTNFTGVTVTLTAIDPNHNFITLGTATTDSSGLYYYDWAPPNIPGNYLITATFAGTNGYWGSSSQVDMVVSSPPPTPAPTAAPVTGLASTGTVELGIAAVIIVIIIIAAIIILTLRRRP